MKNLFFCLIMVTIPCLLHAQVTEEWVARYDGSNGNYDEAYSVAVDHLGNVYVTGQSELVSLNYDCITIKYNPSGGQVWEQRYDGGINQNDIGYSVAVDAADDAYVLAKSHVDCVLFKYSTVQGNELWKKVYTNSTGYSMVLDEQTNIYVTGGGYNSSSGSLDFKSIKFNFLGTEQWIAYYNGPDSLGDIASDIAVDNDGNVYVTGSVEGYLNRDIATAKFNYLGALQWTQTYNGPANYDDGETSSIALDDSGNVYIASSSEQSYGVRDYVTIKYNTNGVIQWIKRFDFGGDDLVKDIAVDNNRNVYVTGWSEGIGTSIDYATIKYNSEGDQLWVSRYNGPDSLQDGANALILDAAGNVYVTGGSAKDWYEDCVTIKYNSNGSEIWVQRYDGPGNGWDQGKAIAVDNGGNVYVTGGSYGDGTKTDYVTIKYSQPAGVKQLSNNIPEEFGLQQNYPNPFNPSTKINFRISDFGFMSLKVYDILGNDIATLVNEELPVGEYEFEFNAKTFPSGVYFYQLKAGNYTATKKMIFLK
jgi:uncharacterized delta-60 repeat protein